MLAHLDNETVFKKAFTDKTVFKAFVKDIIGIDIEVDKIETEKKFKPKVGNIDIIFDIFAESTDKRVIIEIQRIDYDYNFDRFLSYHMAAILQQQQSSEEYKIDRKVYTIIVLTAPYKIDPKTNMIIKDEVLISSCDPRTLNDQAIAIYGHKLIFLNPNFRKDTTPQNYRDWLDVIYESIHNPESYKVNLDNEGIKKVVELIDFENITPEENRLMKINAQKKVVLKLMEKKGYDEGKEDGEKSGIRKTAIAMKKEGFPVDTIAKITQLPAAEIETL